MDFAVLPVVDIQLVGDEWRFIVAFDASVPDVNPSTPLVYTYPGAEGDYEIVNVVSCDRVSGYVVVDRATEGTSQLALGQDGYLIQEPTAGTFNRLKALVQAIQKFSGRMGTVLPATCEPGNTFILQPEGEFYVCFDTDVWTRIDRPSHSDMNGLDLADAHSIYHTLELAIAWHDSLTKKHVSSREHDHSGETPQDCPPVRKLRSSLSTLLPQIYNRGDIVVTTDTKSIFTSYDGLGWELYSTLPSGSVFMFEGSCPPGWERVAELDGKFPLGAPAGVTSGLSSGGADTHDHSLPSLISHTHSISAIVGQSSNAPEHKHTIPIYSGGGGSYVPYNPGSAADIRTIQSSDAGSHTHTATLPAFTTGSTGVAEPRTNAASSLPKYLDLVFCMKS